MSLLSNISLEEAQNTSQSFIQKRRNRGKYLIILATINGYHHFQTRPLMGVEFQLKCIREPENVYDNNAIKVVAPALREVKLDLLDITVRTRPHQTVRNICGNVIGRMPASISKIIAPFKDNRIIGNITALYTGEMHHGKHPVLGDVRTIKVRVMETLLYKEKSLISSSYPALIIQIKKFSNKHLKIRI